jgi:hypothetical protein
MGPIRLICPISPIKLQGFIDREAPVKERSIARVQFTRKFFQLSDAAHKEKLLRA